MKFLCQLNEGSEALKQIGTVHCDKLRNVRIYNEQQGWFSVAQTKLHRAYKNK
jgi:hypothetical protein